MGPNARALIVGGGIAGMSAAIMLRRGGVHVDLIDIDPEWRVYGAGITITGPTLRAFQGIGILDRVIAEAHTHEGVQVCSVSGERLTIVDTPAPIGATNVPGAGGIMRPVLHRILSDEVRRLDTGVRLGVSVAGLAQHERHVDVRFSDATTAQYDLVIGADGLFSTLRTMLFPDAPVPQFTGQACWRLMTDRLAEVERRHFFLGGPVKAGLTPVSASAMYMFVLENVPVNVRVDPATAFVKLRALLEPYGGLIGRVRDDLNAASAIVYRPLDTVLLPDPWYRGHVILIGDAAHGTTPQLASGAGMAVEDGIVLAEELFRSATIDAGFARFMERRFARCRLVVENSVQMGRYEVERAPVERQTALLEASLSELAKAI